MISYGGIPLDAGDSQTSREIAERISPEFLYDFYPRAGPQAAANYPTQWANRDEVPRIGTLIWPTGASRWAYARYLVTSQQMAAIEALSLNQPQYLVLQDGLTTLSIQLSRLGFRPLFDCGVPGLWLLTLVDDRYFWWERPASVVTTVGQSWLTIFGEIASALNITLAVDAIPAAYLTFPAGMSVQLDALPAFFDACAYCVGMKVVRAFDGSVRVMSNITAASLVSANLGLPNERWAGGEIALIEVNNPSLPNTLRVGFPVYAGGSPTGAVTSFVAPLSPTGYSGQRLGYSMIPADGSNGAALQALTTQMGADQYAYSQAMIADVVLIGVALWTPEGASDRIEWTHEEDKDGTVRLCTRIQRPPWNAEQINPPLLAQPFAETFQSNDVFVGTEPILDFIDNPGQVTFTLSDDAANHRVRVTAAIPPAGGGGGTSITVNYISSTVTFNDTSVTINNNSTVTIDNSSTININGFLEICGYQFWCCTTATLGSTVNDWVTPTSGSTGKTVIDVTAAGGGSALNTIIPKQLNGAAGPQLLVINNVSSGEIVIPSMAASGGGGFGIILPFIYTSTGAPLILEQNDCVGLWYDTCASNLWRVLWTTASPIGTAGQVALIGVYNCTNSFANVSLNITLPHIGTYLVIATATGSVTQGAGGIGIFARIVCRLWNTTTASAVATSQFVVVEDDEGTAAEKQTASLGILITTGSVNNVIDLQAIVNNLASGGVAQIILGSSNDNGDTRITYTQI